MPKILVIEDDRGVREMIVVALESAGFEMLQAEDGRVGVDIARASIPDLIVCDIIMPNLDGYGTLKELRSDPTTATIPFIFLTGHAERLLVREAMDLGADDFLTKPFTIPELQSAIQTRLQKRDLLRHQAERRLNELRTNLSLSLPHEIRTPLSGIIGFAEVLRDDASTLKSSEICEMAGIILKSATRLTRLVENFLTYAQLEILSADPESKALIGRDSTVQLAAHIQELTQKKAKEYNRLNDLVLKLEDGEAAISNTNMRRIAEELVDNAFKFSTRGSCVEITSRSSGGHYILTVADHGSGMKAVEISELGAYRQFNREKREQQGSGLGLAIAKTIVDLHGGSLTVRSENGAGTAVTVKLPAPQPS
jgi:two-component system sensor histidine kinase/response regulator